ncbi:MAG: hypothetical protein Q8L59_02770, partial [Phenylobacterium sp.]|nr:hypothetical protein [Phenylobacterium sp.]
MRRLSMTAALGLCLLAVSACNRNEAGDGAEAPATAADGVQTPLPGQPDTPAAPTRRAGLWEQRLSTEGIVQVTRICIDDTLDERLSWWGQQATDESCEKNLVTRR